MLLSGLISVCNVFNYSEVSIHLVSIQGSEFIHRKHILKKSNYLKVQLSEDELHNEKQENNIYRSLTRK